MKTNFIINENKRIIPGATLIGAYLDNRTQELSFKLPDLSHVFDGPFVALLHCETPYGIKFGHLLDIDGDTLKYEVTDNMSEIGTYHYSITLIDSNDPDKKWNTLNADFIILDRVNSDSSIAAQMAPTIVTQLVNKNNEQDSRLDTIENTAVEVSKEYVDEQDSNVLTDANAYTDQKVIEATDTYSRNEVDGIASSTLNSANEYTDTEINNVETYITETLSSNNEFLLEEISDGDTETLNSAKAYADSLEPDLSQYDTSEQVNTKLAGKSDTTHDHNGLYQPVGEYLTSETDPTVPSWAKQASKPAYTKLEVGLGNVDNTSDADKPISTATATALAEKANVANTYTKDEVNTGHANTLSAAKVYTDGKIESIGAINVLKGKVATFEDLPQDAKPGDVWLVGDTDLSEYIYTLDNSWERLGSTTQVNLDNYYDKTTVDAKDASTLTSAKSYADSLEPDLTAYDTSEQVDTKLASKADKSDTYTKAQVDTSLTGKSDTSHNHTGVYQPVGEYLVSETDPLFTAWDKDYEDLSNKPTIPAKTSDLTNDSGYLTDETDPTVPSWAKQASKPAYTAEEVGAEALGAITTHNTSGTAHDDIRIAQALDFNAVSYNSMTGELTLTRNNSTTAKVTIPLANAVSSGHYDTNTKEIVLVMQDNSEIRIPASALVDVYTGEENTELQVTVSAQNVIEAHLKTASIAKAHLDTALADEITGKADTLSLSTVATSGSYNDLSNQPAIPTKTSQLINDSGFITTSSLPNEWEGTKAQWDSLTPAQQGSYKNAYIVETAVADTTPPELTGTLSAMPSDGQVVLTWNAATDNMEVTGYDIEYGTTASYGTAVTSTTNSKTITGLTNGTTYYFRVRAYDSAGNKSSWLTTTAQPVAPADTTAPTLTGSITATPTTNSLELSWNAASDDVAVTGYDIEYGTSTDYGSSTTSTTNSKTLTGLTADTTYYYRVRAYDAAGNKSSWITGSSKTSIGSATTKTLYLTSDAYPSGGTDKKTLSTDAGSVEQTLQTNDIAGPLITVRILNSELGIKATLGTLQLPNADEYWWDMTKQTANISLSSFSFASTDHLEVYVVGLSAMSFIYPLNGYTTIGTSMEFNIWTAYDDNVEEHYITFGSALYDSNVKVVLG